MKKITILLALAMVCSVGIQAQTIYDAAKISHKDLSGTARFVGMGGAMGALGGDISTIGTNPAGIGIFRSHDISATMSFSSLETDGKYDGNSYSSDRNKTLFNGIGVVFSSRIGSNTGLRYVNFGFNYNRSQSFYKDMAMGGILNLASGGGWVSQTNQMSHLANGVISGNLDYNNPYAALLPVMAHRTGLIKNFGSDGYMLNHGSDALSPEADFTSNERGGINQYDFNLSFNFNDRFYLGFTVGAYDVDYRKNSTYWEDYGNDEGYDLYSGTYIDGSGVDFKVGAIVRPFEYSPLRLGFAIHTPVFYNLTIGTYGVMDADLYRGGTKIEREHDDTGNFTYDYHLRTPWKFNASLGYTIDQYVALGFEYEYEDYSTMRFREAHGSNLIWENETAKEMMKGVSTARVGIEIKPIPEFALRAGYNYSSALFEKSAWKDLPYNSIQTDTDFANSKEMHTATFGIGYRGRSFYADLAYKYKTYKEDFYAFDDIALLPTEVTNNSHQVFLTAGFRF